MFTAKIENSNGQILTLTGKEAIYQVIEIQGLNPPQANLNFTEVVGLDGALFNSSKLNTRNLVITVKINGDVEYNRQNLENYFRTKERCVFYFKNERRDVRIEGYVENVECDLFSNAENAQISIICPGPYFEDIDSITQELTAVIPHFEFPFFINQDEPIVISELSTEVELNVINPSDVETGAIFEIAIYSNVTKLEIIKEETAEYITFNDAFQDGDIISVNTNKGKKSATLRRGGSVINLFSKMQVGSTFFQITQGDNIIMIKANNGAAVVGATITRRTLYRGV